MSRTQLMIENLATELMVSGTWAFCKFQGWDQRGFYYFRHPKYPCKITFSVSSECVSETRIKSLLKCELRRRWNATGFRNVSWNDNELTWCDPSSFSGVVRRYLRNNDSKQVRLA